MELVHWLVSKPVLVFGVLYFSCFLSADSVPTTTSSTQGVADRCDNLEASGPSELAVFFPGDTIPLTCRCYADNSWGHYSREWCPQWGILEGTEYILEVKSVTLNASSSCEVDKVFMVREDLVMDTYRVVMSCTVQGSDKWAKYYLNVQGGPPSGRGVFSDHRLLFYSLITVAFLMIFITAFVGIVCRRQRRRNRRSTRGFVRRIQTPNFDGTDNPAIILPEGAPQERPPPYQEAALPQKGGISLIPQEWKPIKSPVP